MTGLELKKMIKELEEKHSNFNELEIVLSDSADYVSDIRHLAVEGLKKVTEDEDVEWAGSYRTPYQDEKTDKEFLVFSY